MTYDEWFNKQFGDKNKEKIYSTKGFNTYDDPIREYMGSYFESHPEKL